MLVRSRFELRPDRSGLESPTRMTDELAELNAELPAPEARAVNGKASALLKAVAGLGVFLVGGYAAWRYDVPLAELSDRTAGLDPVFSWVAFVAVYTLISIFPVPGRDVAKIVAVELFGYASIVAVWLGELVAAVGSYWLARLGGHDLVRLLLGSRAESVDRKLARASAWTVFLWRVHPLVPYRYFNLSAGLVRLSFRPFLVGSVPGMLLRTAGFQVVFVLFGEKLGATGVTTWQIFLFSTVLVPLMVAGWWAMRYRRRSRAKQAGERLGFASR